MATQLITAGATLSGVILTLLANAFLERRRARDGRWLEATRLASQHAVWLREERQNAYAELSLAGENVLQFVRTDIAPADLLDGQAVQRLEPHWHELRATASELGHAGGPYMEACRRDLQALRLAEE